MTFSRKARKPRRTFRGRRSRFPRQVRSKKSVIKVNPSVGPVSPRILTTFKYSDNYVTTLAANAINDTEYRMNSLFDPQVSVGGHQPYGFDQLSALYARYRVYKCAWIVTTPGSSDTYHMAVVPVNGTHSFTSISEAQEYPKAISKMCGAGGSNTQVVKGRQYLPLLGGDKRVEYKSDNRFQALVTADPTEVMHLHIVHQNPTGSSITIRWNVTLKFWCEMYDPEPFSQS